ncbi:hypothetical protein OQA88_1111 [Cercophora sp. LCS_1]
MAQYAAIVKQGASALQDVFKAAASITNDVIAIKHAIENEANKESAERSVKENTIAQAMDALKRVAGDKFNILMANDYDADVKRFSGETPALPLIKVDFGGEGTSNFRIYMFTGGEYDRPFQAVGHRWEADGIQYWGGSENAVTVDKNVMAGCMYLKFPTLEGMTDEELEEKNREVDREGVAKEIRDADHQRELEQMREEGGVGAIEDGEGETQEQAQEEPQEQQQEAPQDEPQEEPQPEPEPEPEAEPAEAEPAEDPAPEPEQEQQQEPEPQPEPEPEPEPEVPAGPEEGVEGEPDETEQ